ncbi:unnamed protein product [Lasius platythorax]|uniref:Uncharacterized protein n=1 Tax=Lasius platythorax TaxID=488582 RepID=A0AAV2PC48_9HYME
MMTYDRKIPDRCGGGKRCVKMVKVARNSYDIHRGRAEECTISDEDIMKGLSKESKNELDLTRKLRLCALPRFKLLNNQITYTENASRTVDAVVDFLTAEEIEL